MSQTDKESVKEGEMKKILILAVVLGLLTGCGGYLARQHNERWFRTFYQGAADKEKLAIDHGECSSYAAMMINIPFADVMGSTYYYERCMIKKGYKK
jgi:uncharacterized protein YceK